MKLPQLFERATSAGPSGPAVLSKILSYLSKQLGVEFTRIPGVEHFKNSSGNGYGIRYVQNGTTRCIRFNWGSESSMGKITSMLSIDVFTGKTHDPNFNIKTHGVTILQALPVIIDILENPETGSFTAFPVDAKLATVTESVMEANYGDIKFKKVKDEKDGEIGTWQVLHNGKLVGYMWPDTETSPVMTNDRGLRYSVGNTHKKVLKFQKVGSHSPERKNFYSKDDLAHFAAKLAESTLTEAHRDDFTPEGALNDFLHELSRGQSFTRSEFIGRYHPVHVGIFDTIMNDFADRFMIQNRRISLASNVNLDRIKDSILSKAGVVEVTKGGAQEVYFKTPAEEEAEKSEHIPYADTLEHLEGLVKALIKGSFNALFVAGKGGTGKTQTVERTLHDAGLTDGSGYFKNTGAASSSGIYTLLYHHRNDIILFDDSDGALRDIDARNIIKAATDTKKIRKLVWNKKSSFIYDPDDANAEDYQDDLSMAPRYYDFKGRIIFVSNLSIDQLDPDGALRTRAFLINVDPTDEELFDHMGKILMDIRLEDGLELTKEERENVLKVVKTGKRKGAASLRSLVRALNLAASGAPNWQKLVELYA